MTAIKIPQAILDDMVAHARETDPLECCGLLAGRDHTIVKQYRIANTVAQDSRAVKVFEEAEVKDLGTLPGPVKAEVAYFMDPKEMLSAFKDMRQCGLELTVIYHSHTHSPAYPSQTDVGLAHYPDAAYLIISLENKEFPIIKAYWIQHREIRKAAVEAV